MKLKILIGITLIITSLFLFSCSVEQEAAVDDYIEELEEQIEESVEDLQETIEEGIEEANADDSILDEDAAALAPDTVSGDCIVPNYPDTVLETENSADIDNSAGSAFISQEAYLSGDDETTIMDWFDSEMTNVWFEESEWNRGSKSWVSGDFDVVGQIGCSVTISVDENDDGSTIGIVLMDFS